ncbi:MAG: hypothetical protein ACLFS2_02555 [Halochromatium sp.]|uniref:hypothetical protein n=1 Tax=Halochromatium sp. TaxID=2049430 RepID=UPI003978DA97
MSFRPIGVLPYIRTLRLNYLSELSDRVQARLREHSKVQSVDEDRWAERLDLSIAPRLSLVDEESASLITGAERAYLEQTNGSDSDAGDSGAKEQTGSADDIH